MGSDSQEAASAEVPTGALPKLATKLSPEQVVATLEAQAKRGKMPGFKRGGEPGAFSVAAFGEPFDRELHGVARAAPGGGAIVEFSLRLPMKLPIVYVAIIIFTIQPGMWLTDSMLKTYWTWYLEHVKTWMWYVPLVVLPLPYIAWRQWTRSARASSESAHKAAQDIATAIGGTAAAA